MVGIQRDNLEQAEAMSINFGLNLTHCMASGEVRWGLNTTTLLPLQADQTCRVPSWAPHKMYCESGEYDASQGLSTGDGNLGPIVNLCSGWPEKASNTYSSSQFVVISICLPLGENFKEVHTCSGGGLGILIVLNGPFS